MHIGIIGSSDTTKSVNKMEIHTAELERGQQVTGCNKLVTLC